MKQTLRRMVIGALALGVTALTACSGSNGSSCTVITDAAGSATINCDDGTSTVIPAGVDGTNGMDGTACSVAPNADGTKTITCDDGTSVVVADGATGDAGATGDPGRDAFIVGPGLLVEISDVTIPDDRRPVVNLTMTDGDGRPLDRAGVHTVGSVNLAFLIAFLESADGVVGQYNNYITRVSESTPPGTSAVQPDTEDDGEWAVVDAAAGAYTYRFSHALPADYDVTKTHTVGVQATRTYEGVRYASNPLFNFRPDGMAVTETREVVTTTGCNRCHDTLAHHGRRRRETGLCIMCHTDGVEEPNSGNSIDFKVMIHKVHMGENLPSVLDGQPYVFGRPGHQDDFTDVAFPRDVSDCATCHVGADGDRWLSNPSRAVCGSCHDRTSFVSPAPSGWTMHPGGAYADDSACSGCHSGGATDAVPGIAGAHYGTTRDPANPTFVLTISGITGTSPTEVPVVSFHAEVDGAPYDILATPLDDLRIAFAGPTTDPSGFAEFHLQGGGVSNSGTITAGSAAGDFVWTPDAGVTMNTIAATCGNSTASGSYQVGLEALLVPDPGGPGFGAMNPVLYFAVTDATAVSRRHSVDIAKCNTCHGSFSWHDGRRTNTDYCVGCHTANLSQNLTPAAGTTVVSTSARFSTMIHRIHTGVDGSNPYAINSDVLDGVRFPGDRRDCETCHVAGSYDLPLSADLLPTRTSEMDSTGARVTDFYMGATAAACTGCHDSDAVTAHTDAMTTSMGDESCAVCHAAGMSFGIDVVHARPEFEF